jgi:hypothetical protein
MSVNRFAFATQDLGASSGLPVSGEAGAFMVCPVAITPSGGAPALWQQVYQLALEQARAVVRPSRWERFTAPSVN